MNECVFDTSQVSCEINYRLLTLKVYNARFPHLIVQHIEMNGQNFLYNINSIHISKSLEVISYSHR